METRTRGRLQKARLALYGVAAVVGIGCADTGARLAARLSEPTWDRYVVQPGDTLARIAACRRVSVATLARVNEISAPDRLRAGDVLRVPEASGCASPRLAVKVPPPRPKAAPRDRGLAPLHGQAARLLAEATGRYDAADFEQALSLAQGCIQALASDRKAKDAEAKAIRARCHVVSGMAAAGLEQSERAIAEFRQALDIAPDLALDRQRSSPRILELVESARANPAASGPSEERFVESSAE